MSGRRRSPFGSWGEGEATPRETITLYPAAGADVEPLAFGAVTAAGCLNPALVAGLVARHGRALFYTRRFPRDGVLLERVVEVVVVRKEIPAKCGE